MRIFKQTKSLLLSYVFLYIITLNGCASINEEILTQKAVYRTYAVTSDQAWEISKAVFRGSGYGVIENRSFNSCLYSEIEENKYTDSITVVIYENGYTPDWGCQGKKIIMGAWIEPLSSSTTNVAFKTSQDYPWKITEDAFHEKFSLAVEMEK